METNMGGLEQAIRFLLGVLILIYAALYLSGTGVYQVVAVIIGAILLATGGIGYCPAYSVFKFKPKNKESNIEYRTGQTSKSKKTIEQRRHLSKKR
jgi:hypothetical protein